MKPHAVSHEPTPCTLRQLQEALLELGLSGEDAAASALELVRRGDVRIVGPYSNAVRRVVGQPTRAN